MNSVANTFPGNKLSTGITAICLNSFSLGSTNVIEMRLQATIDANNWTKIYDTNFLFDNLPVNHKAKVISEKRLLTAILNGYCIDTT